MLQAMKTYHMYHGESLQAESKLRLVEGQKVKVEQHAGRGTLSRKFKNFDKQIEKVKMFYLGMTSMPFSLFFLIQMIESTIFVNSKSKTSKDDKIYT